MPAKKRNRNTLQVGELVLDSNSGKISGPNGVHHLTPMECRLLETLMAYSGQVVPRSFLMKTVWETDYLGDTRTLDVHISWLRKKLSDCSRRPQYLWTVRGVGYWFGADNKALHFYS